MTSNNRLDEIVGATSPITPPKLSICITTFNRGEFIGETLESMVSQMTDDCEIVVLDGGSTDDTEIVVAQYVHRFERVRYIKQEKNRGFDQDCDRAVGLARGEYCWLMTDDDLLKAGAVATVLNALQPGISLAIVNAEERNFRMSRILRPRTLEFATNRLYRSDEMDRLFEEVGEVLMYVGGIIIERQVWINRERERYYGTSFVFVGVIFQSPLPGNALVIAEPLISYRRGNSHAWFPRVIEIVWVRWPSLVATLAVSESAKARVCNATPWRDFLTLLLWRGLGAYSLAEYRRWVRPRLRSAREAFVPVLVALFPGVLINMLLVLYYSVTKRPYRGLWTPEILLEDLRTSRCYIGNWRFLRS